MIQYWTEAQIFFTTAAAAAVFKYIFQLQFGL